MRKPTAKSVEEVNIYLEGLGLGTADNGNLTRDGNLSVERTGGDVMLQVKTISSGNPYINISGASDQYITWQYSSVTKFAVRTTASDWRLYVADDAGSIWSGHTWVFGVNRSTGLITAKNGIAIGDAGPRMMVGTGSPEGAVTAPAGSQWWQTDHATFGYVRWVKDSGTGNTGWLLAPDGRVWVQGVRTSNQSVSDITSTVITYTAETDRFNMLDTGTGKVTLPVAGLWEFSAQISWATDFANWQHASILNETAGTTVASLRTASGPYQVSLSGLMSCSASDVMSVSVFQDSTGSQNVAYARFVANLVGT